MVCTDSEGGMGAETGGSARSCIVKCLPQCTSSGILNWRLREPSVCAPSPDVLGNASVSNVHKAGVKGIVFKIVQSLDQSCVNSL